MGSTRSVSTSIYHSFFYLYIYYIKIIKKSNQITVIKLLYNMIKEQLKNNLVKKKAPPKLNIDVLICYRYTGQNVPLKGPTTANNIYLNFKSRKSTF